MRTIVLLALAVVGLTAVGVIHFQKNGNQVDITVDKVRLEQAAENAVDEGKNFLNNAEQSLEQARQNSSSGSQK